MWKCYQHTQLGILVWNKIPTIVKLRLVIISNYGHHVDNQQHAKEVAQCIKQKRHMSWLVLESGSLEVSIKDLMPKPASILAKLLK